MFNRCPASNTLLGVDGKTANRVLTVDVASKHPRMPIVKAYAWRAPFSFLLSSVHLISEDVRNALSHVQLYDEPATIAR